MAFGWSWKTVDRRKRVVVAFFRMLWITFKGFREDLVTLRAASLTYITLVSIVPTLAFSFAVSKGIGANETLIIKINEWLVDLPIDIQKTINEIINTVQKVDYGKMGATGFLVMGFTTIKLLGKIEHSLNDIWGVKQHRTMMRKFSDYISISVMIPILILASASLTVTLSSESIMSKIDSLLGPASVVVEKAMSLSGVLTIIFAFFLLYIWLPNTKVRVFAAFVGGVVGGLTWKLMLLIFIESQSHLTGANPVYGTFAALPLFLVWLYSSWVVVLFGAEVAFSAQHWRTYDLNAKEKELNFYSSLTLALIIMDGIIESFRNGGRWCPEKFADKNLLSVKNVLATTDMLVKNNILERNQEPVLHFVPARMLKSISVADIVKAIAGGKLEYLQAIDSAEFELVNYNEQKWEEYMGNISAMNVVDI